MLSDEIQIIDSHTGGEPTRVVIAGGPDLGAGPLPDRVERFRNQYDDFRLSLIREPRGTDVLIGALLCEPEDSTCVAAVIFFNNVGYLGMCGHGTIGLILTLHHSGEIGPGVHRLETTVGVVETTLHDDLSVSVTNVPSYRYKADVKFELPDGRLVVGDIAWGGNWFFLVKEHSMDVVQENISQLSEFAKAIRKHLDENEIRGENDGLIDHIEIFGPPVDPSADSKNFVLCPGAEFDRSPCGTGTSAKVACLFADGKLKPGEVFRQESIIGSVFDATIEEVGEGRVLPTIRGTAHVHAETKLILSPNDPFRLGIKL